MGLYRPRRSSHAVTTRIAIAFRFFSPRSPTINQKPLIKTKSPLYELPSKTIIDLREIAMITPVDEDLGIFVAILKSAATAGVENEDIDSLKSDRDNLLKAWQEVASNRFPVSVAPA